VTDGEEQAAREDWYTVRCVFRWSGWEDRPFEERITLWRASSIEAAIEDAEAEAVRYAEANDLEYLEFVQAFAMTPGEIPGNGAELFSMLRDSDLSPDDYLTAFFDTGQEHGADTED
jgi:hypothetical protein